MTRLLGAAWVIARRDYAATVLSRTFLLFLLGPLLPVVFGIGFGALTGHDGGARSRPVVVVTMAAGDLSALLDVERRLVARLGDDAVPVLRPIDAARARAALAEPAVAALLSGSIAHPVIAGPRSGVDAVAGPLSLMVETVRQRAALAHAGIAAIAATPDLRIVARPAASPEAGDGRRTVARVGQGVLFMLTLLLANMLLWNLVEEKSNKVIEVLAAAVPVRAIFLGKLAAMLAISLTAVLAWAAIAGLAAGALLPAGFAPAAPAVGWPVFALLGLAYFVASYLLFGVTLLGLGAQLGSMREIQSVSLPATMVQLVLFGFAGAGIGSPDSAVAHAAAVFPLSSPLAMIARAGETPALWPHALALVWQAGWIALLIAFAAERFRRGVLMSGPAPRQKRSVA